MEDHDDGDDGIPALPDVNPALQWLEGELNGDGDDDAEVDEELIANQVIGMQQLLVGEEGGMLGEQDQKQQEEDEEEAQVFEAPEEPADSLPLVPDVPPVEQPRDMAGQQSEEIEEDRPTKAQRIT